jgi:hypothetical protein
VPSIRAEAALHCAARQNRTGSETNVTDPNSTSSEHLQELLDALHREIEERGPLSPELRDRLGEVLGELRAAVEREASEREEESSPIVARIEDMALEFEAEHPTIAGTLNRLTHLLSSMGI